MFRRPGDSPDAHSQQDLASQWPAEPTQGNGISNLFHNIGHQEYMYTQYLSLGLFQPFEKVVALTVRIDDLT